MKALTHLRAETTRPVFISYSHKDRDAVRKLYADLQALGFKLWRNPHDIPNGEPLWEKIKKAIDNCASVVLCISPDALQSEHMHKEWHYARQQGKRIVPVVVADVDFSAVPRWMGRADWKDFREGKPSRDTIWMSFIRTLNTPYTGRKVPFMAPTLPPYFVERPTEFENLVGALVGSNGAVAITAAVKGAGGFGKTTLAMALCHDNRIRGAFDDGILWVTLGEKPTEADLRSKALDLVYELTGNRPAVERREAVKTELTKAIGDRYVLLVIDDLWHRRHADLFLVGAPHCAVLITTRLDAQLPEGTRFRQNVGAMRLEQAVKLLTWGIAEDTTPHKPALEALAGRLGGWAVLLRLVNAALRAQIGHGETLARALDCADEALTRKGLRAFDSSDPKARADAAGATLQVSLDLLTPEQRERFARLAVFPEDVDVPFTTLERLWGLDDFDTQETAVRLNDAGLLLNFALDARTLRLHDVMRQYLIDEHRADVAAWHEAFVDALGDLYALPDTYIWRHCGYHLVAAGRADRLRALLLDYRWLQAKLDATDVSALMADCDRLPNDEAIRLLKSALKMSAHTLRMDTAALAHQLHGRLYYRAERTEIAALRAACAGAARLCALDNGFDALQAAGGPLLATFIGHAAGVRGALALGDGSLLSWSEDGTLRRWARNGTPLATLVGHTNWVTGALALGDGSLLSWSEDGTLRRWARNGTPLATLAGHTRSVYGALALDDGSLLSWSEDGTLRRWAVSPLPLGEGSGVREETPLVTFIGHTEGVRGALALDDGTLLSWSWDGTLRRWGRDGTPLATLAGHTWSVSGALALDDGTLLSWSRDGTLRRWARDGTPLATLAGHTWSVSGALALNDSSLLSWSEDGTLRRWAVSPLTVEKGSGVREETALVTFIGHTAGVWGALALDDDSLLSWSEDGTLRRWARDGTLLATFIGHTAGVWGALALDDDSLLSWSRDGTLRRWAVSPLPLGEGSGVREETPLATLAGHTAGVTGALALNDGLVLSWSRDGTLRRWARDGTALATLAGHTAGVRGMLALGDGSLLSWSLDGTLRHWARDGMALATLAGHTKGVRGALALGDGSLLSWSWDGALRRWAVSPLPLGEGSGVREETPLATFIGHTAGVRGVLALDDGSLLSWSEDGTLRRWAVSPLPLGEGSGVREETPLATFIGHAAGVRGVLALDDGTLLSWSEDGTLRRWAVSPPPVGEGSGVREETPLATLAGHTRSVSGALALDDGTLLSWSQDGTLRRWARNGTPLATLAGHTRSVYGALVLDDSSLLSWSQDGTLRRWVRDGTPLAAFIGHTAGVRGALALDDGTLLSWSEDGTLRRWARDGTLLAMLNKPIWGDKVRLFAWARKQGFDANVLFDDPTVTGGRAAYRGRTVYVYDPADGRTLARFIGDSEITCLAVSGDVIAAGDAIGRVIFLRWLPPEQA